MSKRSWLALAVPALVLIVAAAVAQTAISTDGVIESKSGGVKFPDGSVQITAAVPLGACPTLDPSDEMIWANGVCIDKYEASVWSQPDGGTQYGIDSDDYPCAYNGQDCDNIYARSVPGVTPSRYITWFQAQAALANVGKRLPTNAEWQRAVMGTQDPGNSPGLEDCNTNSSGPEVTGERENCVSRWGHYDMVGNLWEWVADWDEPAGGCDTWSPSSYGDDETCVGGDGTVHRVPAAVNRGGFWEDGSLAGPFAIRSTDTATSWEPSIGFRGAR